MFALQTFTLDNGLRCVVSPVPSSKLAALNLMYHIGSGDEAPDKTGCAHLFEHLMFSGSMHIPNYDLALQKAGGHNNAYTTADITNYYCILPAVNIETAFWLESDRMLGLNCNARSLALQKKVVVEEFKEYLNKPYGDAWSTLIGLAYQVHPYQWPIIGKSIEHIQSLRLKDITTFFHRFYVPNNAVLVVTGGVTYAQVQALTEKWFAPIPRQAPVHHQRAQEPQQSGPRHIKVYRNVPLNALYKAYHIPNCVDPSFSAISILASLLAGSHSSRLYAGLVEGKRYLHEVHAYVNPSFDPGLLVLQAKLNPHISFEQAEEAIQDIIQAIQTQGIAVLELDKLKNQVETLCINECIDLLSKGEEIGIGMLLGNPYLFKQELEQIHQLVPEDIQQASHTFLQPSNCSTVYYHTIAKG